MYVHVSVHRHLNYMYYEVGAYNVSTCSIVPAQTHSQLFNVAHCNIGMGLGTMLLHLIWEIKYAILYGSCYIDLILKCLPVCMHFAKAKQEIKIN